MDGDDDDDARSGASASDVDPLDAFMATLKTNDEMKDVTSTTTKRLARDDDDDGDDDDGDDAFERMMTMNAARANAARERRGGDGGELDRDRDSDSDRACEWNDDTANARRTHALPAASTSMTYERFERKTYVAPKELRDLSPAVVTSLRAAMDVRVNGCDDVAPIERFGQALQSGVDVDVLKALKRLGFEKPTPIQAQCLPIALAGWNVLAMAKTGSGKTLAYLLPALAHIARQRPLSKYEGPIALVLAPTRELSSQISNEANKLCKNLRFKCCAIFGGANKTEQFKALRSGAELVVATPGRLIDVLTMKKEATNLNRVVYVALDEADRMMDMGFEKAARSICAAIRVDRQCVMFSATMPSSVKRLCQDVLGVNFATISVGSVGAANADVRQVAHVFADDEAREQWFFTNVRAFVDKGQVLVFVAHKTSADELMSALSTRGIKSASLHGDLDQGERQVAMKAFKSEQAHVLVATDLAARGLDVEAIKTVVNYHPARDIDTHVHRIGRTGRAGALDGCAYTLLTAKDSMKFAQQLAANFEAASQDVSSDLRSLSRGSYKRPRDEYQPTDSSAKFGGRGRGGLGFPGRDAGRFGGAHLSGRGAAPPRLEAMANYSAVPPPQPAMVRVPPPPLPAPPPQSEISDMIAQARAKAQATAAKFQFQPQPPTVAGPPPPATAAATMAAAAAQAIAARFLAAQVRKNE